MSNDDINKLYEATFNESCITLKDAYETLTNTAFAVWIRLSIAPGEELSCQENIFKAIGYSRKQSYLHLAELRRKGFIEWRKQETDKRMRYCFILKRGIVSREHRFVNLSGGNFQASQNEKNEIMPLVNVRPKKKRKPHKAKETKAVSKIVLKPKKKY